MHSGAALASTNLERITAQTVPSMFAMMPAGPSSARIARISVEVPRCTCGAEPVILALQHILDVLRRCSTVRAQISAAICLHGFAGTISLQRRAESASPSMPPLHKRPRSPLSPLSPPQISSQQTQLRRDRGSLRRTLSMRYLAATRPHQIPAASVPRTAMTRPAHRAKPQRAARPARAAVRQRARLLMVCRLGRTSLIRCPQRDRCCRRLARRGGC